MKYIIFQEPTGLEYPIVFPELLGHDFVRNSVRSEYPGVTAIRAGFCNAEGACWGQSISLRLSSDIPQDEWLLRKMFKNE